MLPLTKSRRKISLHSLGAGYPVQFWVLFVGVFVSRASASMIWPFLTVYMREKLDVPLTTVTLLLSVQAAASLIATTILGPAMDRFGRKTAMIASLLASALVLVAMAGSSSLEAWVVLIAIYGAVNPAFRIGTDAMVADIVPAGQRAPAYALMRMIGNLGIAIGPVIGGILAAISFELIYHITAVIYLILAIASIYVLSETMPARQKPKAGENRGRSGYGYILRDTQFLAFMMFVILVSMGYTMVFVLLPVYAKENFGLTEQQYNLPLTVNASMVVLFQYGVTRVTSRYRPMPVIAVGALFYAAGISSVALGSTTEAFILSMAVLTVGELIISPTATALVARIAPEDMRARYMSIFGLSYPIASGTGPVIAGYLNDHIAPSAMWYGGGLLALAAAGGFALMWRARINTTTADLGLQTADATDPRETS